MLVRSIQRALFHLADRSRSSRRLLASLASIEAAHAFLVRAAPRALTAQLLAASAVVVV